MKLLRNALTLLSHPSMAGEYLAFLASRRRHGGQASRRFPADGVELGGLSGFGEFHSCAHFIDARERRFLKEYSFGDGVFLDVGANLGLFSLLAARRFPDRPVHAFEPNPTTFAALEGNFARNRCTAAHAHAAAVADREGEISFETDPVDRATTRITPGGGGTAGANRRATVVRCVTLDGFARAENIGRVALLKVDVEGYESVVFGGASTLLASGQAPLVYFEVCPELARQAGHAPDAAAAQLEAHGYSLFTLGDDGRLLPARRQDIARVQLENWIATRPGA